MSRLGAGRRSASTSARVTLQGDQHHLLSFPWLSIKFRLVKGLVATRGVVSQAGPLFALPTEAPRSRTPALAPAPWPQPIPECSFCKGAQGACGAGGAFLSSFKDLMAMLSPPDIIIIVEYQAWRDATTLCNL